MSGFGSASPSTYNSYSTITGDLTLGSSNHSNIILVDSSTGLITVTLPDDLDAGFWCQMRLVDETGGVAIGLSGTSVFKTEGDLVTLVTKYHTVILEHSGGGIWYGTGFE